MVGTGGTGAALTFFTLGIVYFLIMVVAAFMFRVPAEGWRPEGWAPRQEAPARSLGSASGWAVGWLRRITRRRLRVTREDVHLSESHKTPQFYLLWLILCLNITAGIGIIGVAKTMATDIFGSTLPHIVTPGFAVTYVLMISVFNMAGRFFWASISDYLGRKNTFYCFFGLATLLYLIIPATAIGVGINPHVVWLLLFCAATMLAFSIYGGGFATIPAYLADVFGTLHVGAIHGRLLTAWSAAGLIGPFAITYLRDFSEKRAINDLASRVNPVAFEAHFDAPLSRLQELIAAKTVTVGKLMEIAPPDIADPTPSLYNITMFVMAGLLALAIFANMAVRPVAERHLLKETHPELAAERD